MKTKVIIIILFIFNSIGITLSQVEGNYSFNGDEYNVSIEIKNDSTYKFNYYSLAPLVSYGTCKMISPDTLLLNSFEKPYISLILHRGYTVFDSLKLLVIDTNRIIYNNDTLSRSNRKQDK